MVLVVVELFESGISDMERIIHTVETFGIKVAMCVKKYDVNFDHIRKIMRIFAKNKDFNLWAGFHLTPTPQEAWMAGNQL